MRLTYSKAYGYKNARKNNETKQLEKTTKVHNQNLQIYNNIKENKKFTYLSPADGRLMSSAFS